MPRVKPMLEQNVDLTTGLEGQLYSPMMGVWGPYTQITPVSQGPESLELGRRVLEVLRSLEELETMRPYLSNVHHLSSAWLSSLAEASETSLDYQSPPPTRTIPMNTQFFIRGRGQPKPYPLEDE